jgi:tripartite-type tricarboxylate transporter receptor subunit TctC
MVNENDSASIPRCLNRRRAARWLADACVVLAAGIAPLFAQAASPYPNKPVKFIAPYATGGTVDALTRAFAQAYSVGLHGTFVVDNKAGAGGNIGLTALAKSPPDGYTLGLAAANMLATNRWLYKALPFDPAKDFAPVAFIGRVPLVLIVNNDIAAKTLPELVALMKSKTMEFNFGSSGIGNTAHLFGELFKTTAGVQMVHVPYKSSGEALQELLSGRLQLMFITPTELMPQLARGAVRPIALAGPDRISAMPDVPTFTELGMAGFETPTWFGIVAPAGTPSDIVETLNRQTREAMSRPEVKARLEQIGATPQDMSPAQFHAFIEQEAARWEKIVKQSGIRID